jgi:hypothetical protein
MTGNWLSNERLPFNWSTHYALRHVNILFKQLVYQANRSIS